MSSRLPTTVRWFLGSAFSLALFMVLAGAAWWHQRSPLWAPFRLDPNQPFRIELGRGSGMNGLTTVRVEQDGTVTLHGLRNPMRKTDPEPHWVTATLRLTPEGLAEVLAAVEDTHVLGLAREHHDPDVADGSQWVLWVKQGERERAIYCNNQFPLAMLRFSERLDDVLGAHMRAIDWRRVPEGQEREHERELWDSIKR